MSSHKNTGALKGLIPPAMSIWGKPLGAPKKEEKTSEEPMPYDEDDVMDEQEIDVDAELANEDASDADLYAVDGEIDDDDADLDDGEYADEEPDYDSEIGDNVRASSAPPVVEVEESVAVDAGDSEFEEVEAAVVSQTKRKKGPSMTATEKKKSISDYIRDEIASRQASGDSLRGKDIVAALAEEGVIANPAQVSQLLKKAGVKSKPRATKTTPARVAQPAGEIQKAAKKRQTRMLANKAKPVAVTSATSSTGNTVDMLKSARCFVGVCGSHEKATEILAAFPELAAAFQD